MKDEQKQNKTGTSETAKDLQAEETQKTSQNDREPSIRRPSLHKLDAIKPNQVIGKPVKDHTASMKQESLATVKRKETHVPQKNERSNQRGQTPRRSDQNLAETDRANQSSWRQNTIKKGEELSGQRQRLSRSGNSTETKARQQKDSYAGRHLSFSREGLASRQSVNGNQNNVDRFSKGHREKQERKSEKNKEPEKMKNKIPESEQKEKRTEPRKLSREYSERRETVSNKGPEKKEKKSGSISPKRSMIRESLSKSESNKGPEKKENKPIWKSGSIIPERSRMPESLSKSERNESREKKEKKSGFMYPQCWGRKESLSNSESIESREKKDKKPGPLEQSERRESLGKSKNNEGLEKKEKKSGPVSPEHSGRRGNLGKSENGEGSKKKTQVGLEDSKRRSKTNTGENRKEKPSEQHKESAAFVQQMPSDNERQESREVYGSLRPNTLSLLENKDTAVKLSRLGTSENNEIKISQSEENKHTRDGQHNFATSHNVDKAKEHETSHNSHRDSLKEQVKQSKFSGPMNDSYKAAQETKSAPVLRTHTSDDGSSVWINDDTDTPLNFNLDKDSDVVPKTEIDSGEFRRQEDPSSLLYNASSPEPSSAFGTQIESDPCAVEICVNQTPDPQRNDLQQHRSAPSNVESPPIDTELPFPSSYPLCTETVTQSTPTGTESSVPMTAITICSSNDQQDLQAIPIYTDCVYGPPLFQTVSEEPEICITPPYSQAVPLPPDIFITASPEDLPLTHDEITTTTPPFTPHTLPSIPEQSGTPLESQAVPCIADQPPTQPQGEHRQNPQNPRQAEPTALSNMESPSTDHESHRYALQEQTLPMHIPRGECHEDELSLKDFHQCQSAVNEPWQTPAQMTRDGGLSRVEVDVGSGRVVEEDSRRSSTSSFHSCVSAFSPDSLDNPCNESKAGFCRSFNTTVIDVNYIKGSTITRKEKRVVEEIAVCCRTLSLETTKSIVM